VSDRRNALTAEICQPEEALMRINRRKFGRGRRYSLIA